MRWLPALILPFAFLAAPALGQDCSPARNMQPEEEDCELLDDMRSEACRKFVNLMGAAIRKYDTDYAAACREAQLNAQRTCPGGRSGQNCSTAGARGTTGNAAGRLQALINALDNYHREIAKLRDEFDKELDRKERDACSNSDRCDKAFTPERWGYFKREDPSRSIRGEEVRSFRSNMKERFAEFRAQRRPPSDVTGTDREKSPFLAKAAEITNKMNSFQTAVDKDIESLRAPQRALQQQTRTNDERNKGLDTNNSDVTGGQPQQAGGAPPGGGSPGGGGSPQAEPSSISDQNSPGLDGTSPTPGNPNEGAKFAEDDEKKKKGPSTIGPGGTGMGDLTPGKGSTPGTRVAAGPSPGLQGSGKSFSPEGSDAYRLNAGKGTGASKVGSLGGGGLGNTSGSSSPRENGGAPKAAGNPVAADSGGDYSGGGGGGGDGGGAEEVLSPFGKPLGDPKLTLAGSETDASVKNLMDGFNPEGEAGLEGHREIASEDSDGIGEKNGPSLFERARAFYDKCARNACVSGFRRKTSGG